MAASTGSVDETGTGADKMDVDVDNVSVDDAPGPSDESMEVDNILVTENETVPKPTVIDLEGKGNVDSSYDSKSQCA